jgi:hypothetical protein
MPCSFLRLCLVKTGQQRHETLDFGCGVFVIPYTFPQCTEMSGIPEHNDLVFHICDMWTLMIAYEVCDFSEHTSVSDLWVET